MVVFLASLWRSAWATATEVEASFQRANSTMSTVIECAAFCMETPNCEIFPLAREPEETFCEIPVFFFGAEKLFGYGMRRVYKLA